MYCSSVVRAAASSIAPWQGAVRALRVVPEPADRALPPSTGAYSASPHRSRAPFLPSPTALPTCPRFRAANGPPIGRWILTTLVALVLIFALIVALAEGFEPINDTIASVTHIHIHAAITNFVDFLLSLLPH